MAAAAAAAVADIEDAAVAGASTRVAATLRRVMGLRPMLLELAPLKECPLAVPLLGATGPWPGGGVGAIALEKTALLLLSASAAAAAGGGR